MVQELVLSIDALTREQLRLLVDSLGWSRVRLPNLVIPGARPYLPLSPAITEADKQVRHPPHPSLPFALSRSPSVSLHPPPSRPLPLHLSPPFLPPRPSVPVPLPTHRKFVPTHIEARALPTCT